jgi:UDP-glucose 4-epimerase
MERILVCGGAGYIGSHMVRRLLDEGFKVTVFDSFETGHREAVPEGTAVFEGNLNDPGDVRRALEAGPFEAVFHFAARIQVGESVKNPALYYANNVAGTLNLLQGMVERGVGKFVFSSSAAVYGTPLEIPIREDHPLAPINPYGWTKRMVEQILADFWRAYGLASVSLRYFNACGADPKGLIGESHDPETHLIPNILKSALSGAAEPVTVFGDDYPTPDGTCVRDYVHVCDLAEAHLNALESLGTVPGVRAYNLGNGRGFSVMEVLAAAERVLGTKIKRRIAPRREGDPAYLVADSALAMRELGWRPRFGSLEEILQTALRWHRRPRY